MILFQSLFDIIREAQKRREMKKATAKFTEPPPAIAKADGIVTKTEESSKRPESH